MVFFYWCTWEQSLIGWEQGRLCLLVGGGTGVWGCVGGSTQSREAAAAMPLTSNGSEAEMCASITSCLRLNDILAGGSMMLLFAAPTNRRVASH